MRRQQRGLAAWIPWLPAIAVWAAALAFGAWLSPTVPPAFDPAVLTTIQGAVQGWLTPLVRVITFTGDPIFYVLLLVPLVLWLWKRGRRLEALVLAGAVLVAWGGNEALKALFQRVRPHAWMLIPQGGNSYPSGHSMVGMAFYSTAAMLLKPHRPKYARFLRAYAFLPGLSRLYLGVHWPSDVAFGLALGWTVALAARRWVDAKRVSRKER